MRLPMILALGLCAAVASAATPYGEPMPEGETVPVSQAIAAFDAHADRPQRFSGRITEVCQARGCWMMLEDAGVAARVMFGQHAFFIPKDSTGTAVVHGVLARKTLTPEQAKHLGADGGKGLAVETEEYRITADGIEIGG